MAHVTAKTADNAWASYWQNKPMPILEASKSMLQHMLRRAERVRAQDVAQVVQNDPLLTLQALRFIGRRERTAMAAEVVSVESIVMLMGVAPFLERFGSLPTAESMLQNKPQAYADFLQQVFLARFSARLAQIYADMRYDARIDEITIAALLSRSNQLLQVVGRQADVAMPAPDATPVAMLQQMQLASAIVALLDVRAEAPARVVLHGATLRLAEAMQTGWWQAGVQRELALIADLLEVEEEDIWQVLCRTALSFARDPSALPGLMQPARWLAMLPGDWPRPQAEAPAQANPPEAKVDPLHLHLQALQAAARQRTPAKEVMALAIRALGQGLGMQRIVFALMVPGQAVLRARYVTGWPANHAMRDWQERTDVAGLLARLLEKPQGLWLNPGNAAKYLPHLPAVVRNGFGWDDFCLMSIFAGSKPIGLIMADRNGTPRLTDTDYQHFKKICLLTTQALTFNAEL